MTGKWHVTKHVRPTNEAEKSNWPLQHRFDRFYGTIHGAGSFYDPNSLTRDNEPLSPFADKEYQPEQYYYTDAISDHAAQFVQEHHDNHGEQPFLCMLLTLQPIGRCMHLKKISPNTAVSMLPVMTRFATPATNACSTWA